MATLTQTLINRARTILQDAEGTRWPDLELLGWINDGQRESILVKPSANARNLSVRLVQGTRQSLPADGVQLIDVVRNMGAAGTDPGKAVRIVLREVLDAQVPDWHSETPASSIKHYVYSVLDPQTFYVYPPSNGLGYVELVYGALPADVTIQGSISLGDIYANALLDYMLYRAYSKDSEFSADQNRAAIYQSAFISALVGKSKVEAGTNPNSTAPANISVTPNTR